MILVEWILKNDDAIYLKQARDCLPKYRKYPMCSLKVAHKKLMGPWLLGLISTDKRSCQTTSEHRSYCPTDQCFKSQLCQGLPTTWCKCTDTTYLNADRSEVSEAT